MVTVVGVAYRGQIPLEDIKVDFEVEPIELPNSIGFGVRELVTLKGNISETERVRLQRAAQYCPVGQAITKGSMQIEDEVQWSSGEVTAASPAPEGLPALEGVLPAIRPGTVRGRYLLDTKEYDENGGMEHEGEVKVYTTCENLTRPSRWTILGGHSSEGWVPPPFPLAQAAWAASTATTLSRLLPQGAADANDIAVELGMAARGDRGSAQGNAAAGVVARRQAFRRVLVPGTPRTTPLETIQAALQRDPITIAYREGGVLLQEEVVVE
ncbi:MAG: OsmC family protein [Dehalococcoidia bacterium]